MLIFIVVGRVYFCTCVVIIALHLAKSCTVPVLKYDATTKYADGCGAGNQVADGTRCTVMCKDGFIPVENAASNTIECDTDNTWEASEYTCGTFLMHASGRFQVRVGGHGLLYEVSSGGQCPGSQESSEGSCGSL